MFIEGNTGTKTELPLCGRLVVLADVGANAEFVEEGLAGFEAESATLSGFGTALERSWNGPARWAEMGVPAHAASPREVCYHCLQARR